MSAKANIVVDQGSTFSTNINLTDSLGNNINLANTTAIGQIRQWYTSTAFVNFTIAIANTASGSLYVSLNANTTASMSPGRYVYDIDTVNNDTQIITRVVEGILTVTPTVTQMSGITYGSGY